jgi:LysM repeat protein
LIGLLPVLAAAAFASAGGFSLGARNGGSGGPIASAPTVTVAATLPPIASPVATTSLATLPPLPATATPGTATNAVTNATQAATAAATATRSTTAAASTSATATTTAVVAAVGEATGPFRTYRVKSGDTLKFIAETYGVSVTSIVQASGLRDANRLSVGQVLTIPSQPGYLYRVQPGETLDLIAARTGIAAEIIASASKVDANSVKSGDVLLIPDGGAAPGK